MKILRTLILFLAALLPAFAAQAAWWEFGRESSEPAITELRFNSIDAARLDDGVVLGKDDLANGQIVVRGRAEVGRGEIGLVEISLDGGKTWKAATLADRGLFTFEFRPDMDRKYDFRIRAISTTGVATGAEENDFYLLVSSTDGSDEAKAAFRKLLDQYQAKNRTGFMDRVAESFRGDYAALDDALLNDFRYLDSIAIQANITRVVSNNGVYELYFTYNRQVRSVKSGQFLKDSAASVVGFRRGSDGMKLYYLSEPLIFGVSGAGEVATSVTGQSVGQTVLTLTENGDAGTGTQGQTVTGGGSESGTHVLNSGDSYEFATDSILPFGQGDFSVQFEIQLHNNAGQKTISCPISATNQAPATGYDTVNPMIMPVANTCYALQLPGPKYALIEIVSVTTGPMGNTITFRYKYQPNGSRNF